MDFEIVPKKSSSLEQEKIHFELEEIKKEIARLELILGSEEELKKEIIKELELIKASYADERKTKIEAAADTLEEADLIPDEDTIITITKDGYIKRLPPETFKTQGRGGKGVVGLTTKEEDVVEHFFTTTTHSDLLFFTTRGRVFQLKAYDIPVASRTAKGQAIVNFLQLGNDEKVSVILSQQDIAENKFIVMVTDLGVIKKVALEDFANIRRSGLIAVKLKPNDSLSWVKPSTGKDEVVLVTANGQAIRFRETQVRAMGRNAAGVRGLRLKGKDQVVGMEILVPKDTGQTLVVMSNGFGKRTSLSAYKVQGRGGSGIKTAKITPKTGSIVAAMRVDSKIDAEVGPQDMVIISAKGQVIRLPLKSVSVLGRATQGVRLMRFKEEGDHVASVTLV